MNRWDEPNRADALRGDGAEPAPGGGAPVHGARAARRRDMAVAVACGGPILFSPLALALVQREASVLGLPLPLPLVYVFAVWAAGIALTALAARAPGPHRRGKAVR